MSHPAGIEVPGSYYRPPTAFKEGEVSFGAASCPLQAEGGNYNSDWYAWLTLERAKVMAAQAPNKDWGQGKLAYMHPEGTSPECYIPGKAVDHWNRFEEDFGLGGELGLQNYHSGLEMSRIWPERNQPYDRLAIEHYRRILRSCRANGMEPIMDLSHFSLPLWGRDLGGWESKEVVEAFVSFAQDMAVEFRNEVMYWATFNEPDTYSSMLHLPWPVGKTHGWLDYPRGAGHYLAARKNMVLAHKEAYAAIKTAVPEAQVGFTVSMVHYDNWPHPLAYLSRTLMHSVTNNYFAPRMAKNADWVGMQYYWYAYIKGWRPSNKLNLDRSDQGWTLYPEGHYHLLKWLSSEVASKHGIPILITETGLADREDRHRASYIKESVKWTDEAIADGVDCRALCVWAITDNSEWDRGRRPRYGLIAIDYENGLKRSIRPGARAYAELIRQRSTSTEQNYSNNTKTASSNG